MACRPDGDDSAKVEAEEEESVDRFAGSLRRAVSRRGSVSRVLTRRKLRLATGRSMSISEGDTENKILSKKFKPGLKSSDKCFVQ